MPPKTRAHIKIVVMAVIVGPAWVSHTDPLGSTGTITDERDGKTYKTVKMPDGNVWMAENLNYQTDSSWCYAEEDYGKSYCKQFGRLYDWNTAMNACPKGWHLPNREDWDDLCRAVAGGTRRVGGYGTIYWSGVGKKLKSKTVWIKEKNKDGSGTDVYGFSALPGGERDHDDGGSYAAESDGQAGYWWSATEKGNSDAYLWIMEDYLSDVYESFHNKGDGFSVRCLKD